MRGKTMKAIIKAEFEKVSPIKIGRRSKGDLYKAADGTKVCIINKRLREMYLDGEKSLYDAMEAGIAAWTLDEATLRAMRQAGAEYIGVHCTDNESLWTTEIGNFFDSSKVKRQRGRYQSRQMLVRLPIKYWTVRNSQRVPFIKV